MLKIQMLEQLVTNESTGRQHQSNTTWHGTTALPGVQATPVKQSPDRLKGTTCDLFELLEKAQSSRLDDQRCVLPAYFNQAPMAQRQHSLPDECRLSTNNNVKISPVGCAAPQHGTPPASPQQATQSRRLLQETLSGPAPYPMIAVPEKGYWVDGTDHDVSFDHRGAPVLSHQTWRAKIETDDTGKCYRRFYVGRVSSPMLLARKRNVADCSTKHHHTCPDKSGGCFCIFNFRSNLWQRSSSSRSRSGLSDRTAIRPIQSSTRLLSLSGRTAPRPASDE
jgi:hypothetical protein